MRLIEVHIRNFFSYGNNITIIPLDFKTPTLIVGENHDVIVDGEFDNNATGKTTILNAICYAAYGKPISKDIPVDALINNINKKNLYVALIFEADGIFYKIERWRKNSKMGGTGNNGVKISYGDTIDSITNIKTPATKSIDEYIVENIFHMPFDIFVRIVVYSATYDPFLSLPATHTQKVSQTSILEELFGQTELTEKAEKLKEVIKNCNRDIKSLTDLNIRIQSEIERYTEQLEYAKKSIAEWDVKHEEQLELIRSDIAAIEAINFENELELLNQLESINDNIRNLTVESDKITVKLDDDQRNKTMFDEWIITYDRELTACKTKLSPYEKVNFEEEKRLLDKTLELKTEYNDISMVQKTLNNEIKVYVENIKKLNSELDTLNEFKCPYCKQPLHDNDTIINEKEILMNSTIAEYEIKQNELNVSRTRSEAIVDELDIVNCMFDTLEEFNKSKQDYDNLIVKLNELIIAKNPYDGLTLRDVERTSLQAELKQLLDTITEQNTIKNGITPSITREDIFTEQARLKELKKQLVTTTSEINPHAETVERLTKVFNSIDVPRTDEIDRLVILQNHREFLLKLLTKKDSFVRQALLDANLPLLNTRLRHYLDIIALPHNVMFTKEMKISISQFNNEIGYTNLSSGQRARINIAIAFAFRDVVQARHQKINFCILDECLDTGLSNLGVKLAAKMIKQVAKENDLSMYVITHRDEIKASFEKRLTAILKGGLTEIRFS